MQDCSYQTLCRKNPPQECRLLNEKILCNVKAGKPRTKEACERLNRTVLEEFYQVAFRSTFYSSLVEINDDLNQFIEFNNFKELIMSNEWKYEYPLAFLFSVMRRKRVSRLSQRLTCIGLDTIWSISYKLVMYIIFK